MIGRIGSDRGFVLLEALVAFLVLSLVLGAAMQAVAMAATSVRRAEVAEDMANVAARLFASKVTRLSEPGVMEGREERAVWRVTASPVGTSNGDRALLAVEMRIWSDGRQDHPPEIFHSLVDAGRP